MKLLLFSDVHCNEAICRMLVEKSMSVDIVVGAGDIGLVREGLQQTIDFLRAIRKPTVLVPGNSESFDELRDACRDWPQANVLHGSSVDLGGNTFFGVGGGIPITPFGSWSWDFSEEEAENLLADCPRFSVLVSHSPPKGVVDVSSTGQSFGSRAIRAAILNKSPILCVCGHIHESAGKKEILGSTPVVNAGPGGLVWEIP